MALSKHGHIDFRGKAPVAALEGTAGTLLTTAAQTQTAADTTHDLYIVDGMPVTLYHASAGTAFTPLAGATGWGLPVDATDNEGCLLTIGAGVSNANCPWCFTVGTDPAFFMRWTGQCADPTVADLVAASAFFFGGFRTAGAYSANNAIAQMTTQALMTSDADATPFADIAALSVAYTAGADLYTLFKTNSAAGANVDTTFGAADGVRFALEVRVSAAGVVSCYYNMAYTDGAAMTLYAVSPGTVTNAVVLQPMIGFVNGTTGPTAAYASIVSTCTWGYV